MSETRCLWLITDDDAVVEVEATLTPFPNPKHHGWQYAPPPWRRGGPRREPVMGEIGRNLFETRKDAVRVAKQRIRRELRRLGQALVALDAPTPGARGAGDATESPVR